MRCITTMVMAHLPTSQAGLAWIMPILQYGPLWSVGGVWVDLNNDGLLDLVVINYLSWDPEHDPDCEVGGHRDVERANVGWC